MLWPPVIWIPWVFYWLITSLGISPFLAFLRPSASARALVGVLVLVVVLARVLDRVPVLVLVAVAVVIVVVVRAVVAYC